jgi:hypothetical protein
MATTYLRVIAALMLTGLLAAYVGLSATAAPTEPMADPAMDAVFATDFGLGWACEGGAAGRLDCHRVVDGAAAAQEVALADLNGDHELDAVFARTAAAVCLTGSIDGLRCHWIDANLELATGLALGDVDGDGHVDVVFGQLSAPNRLCFGDGAGDFVCQELWPAVTGSGAVAIGDLDEDSVGDVIVAGGSSVRGGYGILCPGNPARHLDCRPLTSRAISGDDVVLGDVDQDGHIDVLLWNISDAPLLCLGDGQGRLDCSELSGMAPSIAPLFGDVNGDGHLDLVHAGQRARLCLNVGGRAPIFRCLDDAFDGLGGLDVALADMNGDGTLDAVFAGPDRVCLGLGAAAFWCTFPDAVEPRHSRSVALGQLSTAWQSGPAPAMATPAWTPTPTPTLPPTDTPSPSRTPLPTLTPTLTATPGPSPTPTQPPTATPPAGPPAAVQLRELGWARLPLTGAMPATVVVDGRAYVAGTACPAGQPPASPKCEGTLLIFDVAGQIPELLGRYRTSGEWLPAVDLAIRGNYAYLVLERRTPSANDGFELRILNVADPAHVVAVGDVGMPESREHRDLIVAGDHLYWSAWYFGATPGGTDVPTEVRIYDLAQPEAPVELSRIPVHMRQMVVRDGRLFGTLSQRRRDDGSAGFGIFDVSNPSAPTALGTDIEYQPIRQQRYLQLALAADHAFLLEQGRLQCSLSDPRAGTTDCGNGLVEFDITEAHRPKKVWDGVPMYGQVFGPLAHIDGMLLAFGKTPQAQSALVAFDTDHRDRSVAAYLPLDAMRGDERRYGLPFHFAVAGDRVFMAIGVGSDLGDIELRVAQLQRVNRVFLPALTAR